MVQENHMQVHFDAKSVNEGLARMVVTAFMTNMNPTLEQIADVKTAVSEARSKKGEGTRVVMWKYIEREREQ